MALSNDQRAALERLANDPDFFQQFRDNPEAALAEYDIAPMLARGWHGFFKTQDDVHKYMKENFLSLEESAPPDDRGDTPKTDVPREQLQRIVNTGFVADATPLDELDATQTLGTGTLYYFWLDISNKPSPKSIELTPTSLPTDLPLDAELDVVLFEFPREAKLLVGSQHGRLKLRGTSADVLEAADVPERVESTVLAKLGRLFFKIQTPDAPGAYRLRSNIYYQQTLLQSRLITFHVTQTGQTQPGALTSELDYAVSKVFDPAQFKNMGVNVLSLLLNDDGDGTHGFRLFGKENYIGNATLTEHAIKKLIDTSRQELRRSAWGDIKPFKTGNKYLYSTPNLDQLKFDLIRMAQRGFQFFNALVHELSDGDREKRKQLRELMRTPGQVQIAAKQSLQLVLPAALIYDYPLDDGLTNVSDYAVCPDFLKHLTDKTELGKTDCFQGRCPSYEKDNVICPGGFWGYRHAIGLPIAIKNAPDAPTSIPSKGTPHLAVSVSTDPQFKQRPDHEKRLQALKVGWAYADSRDASIQLLKETDAEIVYYYCHGGITSTGPYIMVGPNDGARLTPANLLNKDVFFDNVRPLVFINGCHTTALTPENGFDMVSAFIQTAHAAGVIGTEITIFESIATQFSEAFFRRFLLEKQPVGEAIRDARLEMLQASNPLGLVYVPYAMPGLRLN